MYSPGKKKVERLLIRVIGIELYHLPRLAFPASPPKGIHRSGPFLGVYVVRRVLH